MGEQIDPGMMAMMQGQGPEIQAQPQGGVPMDYSPQNVGQSYAQQFEAIQAKYEAQIDEIERKIEKLNNRLSENPSDRTVQNQIKRLEAKKEKLEQQMDAEVQYLMDQVEQTGAMAEEDPMSAMHNKEGNLEGYANSEEQMPMMQYGRQIFPDEPEDAPEISYPYGFVPGQLDLNGIDTRYKGSKPLPSNLATDNMYDVRDWYDDFRKEVAKEKIKAVTDRLDRPLSDYALLGEGIANMFDNRAYKANEEAGRLKYSDNPYTRELDNIMENRYNAESMIRRNAQMDETDLRRSINRRKSSNDARSMGQKFAYNTMFDMIGDENAEKIRRQRDADIAKSDQYYDSLYANTYDKYANTQLENEQLNRGIDVNRINQALRIGNERKATRRDNLNMIASILGDEKDLQYYKDNAKSWVELQKSIMDKVRLGMSYDDATIQAIKEEQEKRDTQRNKQTSKKKGR